MIRSLKLFAACVDSMRTAEKEYQKTPTPFNDNVMKQLQEKVDAWVKWIHEQEDAELARRVPPFLKQTKTSRSYEGSANLDMVSRLRENHTEEKLKDF